MSKTKATLDIEKLLEDECRQKRIYGCPEVTIGFFKDGKADEHADFMSVDSSGIIRCYEIKVSLSDLRSNNKLSFYGHYNYLVVSEELYKVKDNWGIVIPSNVGIIVAEKILSKFSSNTYALKIVKNPKKEELSEEKEIELTRSLARSLYYKMVKFKDGCDEEKLRSITSEARKNEVSYKKEHRALQELENKHYRLVRYLIHRRGFTEDDLAEYL